MKNLVLFAGVMVAACFAACTSNKPADAPVEEEVVAVEEVVDTLAACCDSCCADSCCAAADSCCAVAE